MDSLTHIAIGACIGELIAGRQLGKKAMVLGAIAQSIPDIDFITSYWMPVASDLLAHRGFTHSLLFGLLMTLLLSALSARIFPQKMLSYKKWGFFWGIQIFMHLFLDIFNVYGTGLFEPFSHYRVSLNTFFVVDPLFCIWPVVALTFLAITRTTNKRRKQVIATALSLSGIYMCYSVVNKLKINSKVKDSLVTQHIPSSRFFSTPTPLNNMLWYIVAQADSGYYIGYRSVMDKQDKISYRYVAGNHTWLDTVANASEVNTLKRFSQGYYVAKKLHDTLIFNDLRFGEMTAGLLPDPRFCFYYYLSPQASNAVIIQRGRFCGWDKNVLNMFVQRIMGRQNAAK